MKSIAIENLKAHLFVVDLDDSLIATDLLYERILGVLRHKPFLIPVMVFKFFSGRLAFKQWLKDNIEIDYSVLPYRNQIIGLVQKARANGNITVLLSGAPDEDVQEISRHLKIFDVAQGSVDVNFVGVKKANWIHSHYPEAIFSYVGDSKADWVIWEKSVHAVAVNPSHKVGQRLIRTHGSHEIIRDRGPVFQSVLKQIRVHQWPKNLLVFLPLIAKHSLDDSKIWWQGLQAFAAFSLMASVVYLMNDLCDLESDRKHLTKKHRPLAAGKMSLSLAFFLIPCCLLGQWGASIDLNLSFWLVLYGYLILNVGYSFKLKKYLALDVVILSIFYTMRILAGGLAAGVAVSEWLLSFSVFFFFGLAMVKRVSELKLISIGAHTGQGRGYTSEDVFAVMGCGLTASFLSLLVLALYLNSPEVRLMYQHPSYLWLWNPSLLYWMTRLWILANRGSLHDDPVVFAFHDRITWCVGLCCLAILLAAM